MTDILESSNLREKLCTLGLALVNQELAQVAVPPQNASDGYWFGGGNVIMDKDGSLLLCGRYRNYGDSRTGTGAGERGLEFAIFRSPDPFGNWEKIKSFTKSDLACNGLDVVSIEGGGLLRTEKGYELFISTEKDKSYPEGFEGFQKPGTGVWSIDWLVTDRIENLNSSKLISILKTEDLATLHIKDPVPVPHPNSGTALLFCNHPFNWSSSNTGLATRESGTEKFIRVTDSILQRGKAWDVACTRLTERLPLPRVGILKDLPALSLYFYDGAECLRQLDENPLAVTRTRGWSCEEIGGLAVGIDDEFPKLERLSVNFPLFTSTNGTGSSRYVSTVVTHDGILSAWQQSQNDRSQPLVTHFLAMEEVENILN
ncbi:MAG: exo-alpha-sialidase [Opitutae bacterium]|nr:exo-alpha-sialidase [Opitutae bacterium]MBT6958396.1 exo-alpha-sialidase [Opitutae bacterium]MBT7854147.1 exo-alpha-sialidase [Opitutae bacterium]